MHSGVACRARGDGGDSAAVGGRGLLLAVVQAFGGGVLRSPSRHRLVDRGGNQTAGRYLHRCASGRRSAVAAGKLVCMGQRPAAALFARRCAGRRRHSQSGVRRADLQSYLDGIGGDAGGDARHALHRHQRGLFLVPVQGAGKRQRGVVDRGGRGGGPGAFVEILGSVSGCGNIVLAVGRRAPAPLAIDTLAVGRSGTGGCGLRAQPVVASPESMWRRRRDWQRR